MSATATGPRVRLRWRIELTAQAVQSLDGTHLRHALRCATAGMPPGVDVIVVVCGALGVNVGAGTAVGQYLSDARTVEVEACGSCAQQFVDELQRATAEWQS